MAVLRRIGIALACALALACSVTVSAHAVQPDEILSDPVLEQRARVLSRDLRCMVCQNQSIDDSDAPLARDLRLLVRERLKAGDSDGEVRSFLVDRYGEFVLLTPRLSASTALLWAAPLAILIFGGIVVLVHLRRRREAGSAPALRPEEERRIEELLRPKA